jgi:hypothetical protein
MHAEACGMSRLEHRRERIEAVGLPQQFDGPRLDSAEEVRVASPADLDEQRIEAVIAGGTHEGRDVLRRGQRGAQDPHRAYFSGSARGSR